MLVTITALLSLKIIETLKESQFPGPA